MSIRDTIKKYRLIHWLYNLWNSDKLSHNKAAYKKYNLKKSLFSSISSKDFPDKESKAWLDITDSAIIAPQQNSFASFTQEEQQQIRQWSSNGYMILKNFFDDTTVDRINTEIEQLENNRVLTRTFDNKILYASKHAAFIKQLTMQEKLLEILKFLLNKEVVLCQTLNFTKGSGQRAHSDSIHMTTYPLGYLVAVWVALEDIHPDSGPLFYYPGSHKLPYLLNNDFDNIGNAFSLGKKEYSDYEDVIEELIEKKHLQREVFLAKKGDILIWHANLLHGGMPVVNKNLTRKSMVMHYYAKDVIKYHEITERPSLIDG